MKIFLCRSQCSTQQGWIILEVIFTLVLLAVVMNLAQHQSVLQWESIDRAQMGRALLDNRNKQEAMVLLTGSEKWRALATANARINTDSLSVFFHSNVPSYVSYPSCQLCSGVALETWFKASQIHLLLPLSSDEERPSSEESLKKKGGPI